MIRWFYFTITIFNIVGFFFIRKVVSEVVKDMQDSGEIVPEPISCKRYSGKFMLRIPPELHRKIAIQAAENGVGLNRLASAKLSRYRFA